MTIGKLLADPSLTLADLSAHLDSLDHASRMEVMGSSSKADQRKLWNLAAESPPMTFEDFVPPSVPDRTEVIHHGRNTLPVFNSFQKRFARPEDGTKRLFGYNEGATRPLIGPGFFVAIPTAGNPRWEERGAWVVDYFQVPDGPVPQGWPRVRANWVGLQVLVYHHTRDFMRKVSKHVSIGIAFKSEFPLNNWFTLVREER